MRLASCSSSGGYDVAGIADPTGLADLANATIYAGRGQWGNAGISAIRILPYVGDLGKAGRLASKVVNAAELARIQNVANRNGQKDRMLTYKGGNAYWNDTGKKYAGRGANNTIWRTLKAYQTIEKSNDGVLKNQLHTLETSEHKHFIEASPNGDNAVRAYGIPDEKGGVGTQTEFDFSNKNKAEFEKSEGVKDSDLSTVSHELRHQYDNDTGNMKDNRKSNTANDPAEIRGVANENRARKLEGLPARTTYGGKKIDPEKLKNPPNN